ncbi:lytic transglycosylase domain-containing protein [Fluviispira multicolorata]|uniref:Transglycosylase SLT domain-containing protein n=1 Tax=Fluviispira multicolorata TaxID=2654512 RepID=A0A833JBE9_9BACT|nr:lytic transglycosylase domain-containing protein [Fluviispira multicolorata]KAB8029222.1 transglycosylase SLT domain-containing protein [Fluviispira multicolorata]
MLKFLKIKEENSFRAFIILSSYIFILACSSNPILTENLELTLPDQKQMQSRIERNSSELYLSNLSSYTPPKENQLIEEANFKNLKLYNESAKILSDWILRTISQKDKSQLAKNCEALIGGFKKEFPLNEQSLACTAWWLDRKNNEELNSLRRNSYSSSANSKRLTSKQKHDWENFRGMSFTDSFLQIDPDNLKQAVTLSAKALNYSSDCDFAGATSAVILRLESFLPNHNAYSSIEKLYSKVQKCLLPNLEGSEKVHLRVGLFRLISGFPNSATQAFEKALLEKDPQESSRSLFWLGAIYQKNNRNSDPSKNPFWQKLLKEVPISLAAIVASQQMGVDPMENLVPDDEILLQSREAQGWNDNNLEAFIFDLMRARKDQQAATEWAGFVARTTAVSNPKMLLYWALAQNSVYNYRYSISMLGRYSKSEKNFKVSKTLLYIFFPKPYLREISDKSIDIDPIFVLSVIRQESAFDPYARSGANARGLMQILPSTAKSIKRKVSAKQLYDPFINIEVGISYLNRLLRRYDGRIEYVLAAYNAGASNLDKWRDRVSNDNMMLFSDYMPFRETRSYVSIILRNYYWYGRILSEKDDNLARKIKQQSAQARWKSDSILALLEGSWKTNLDAQKKALLEKIYIFGNNSSQMSAHSKVWKDILSPKDKTFVDQIKEEESKDKTAFTPSK